MQIWYLHFFPVDITCAHRLVFSFFAFRLKSDSWDQFFRSIAHQTLNKSFCFLGTLLFPAAFFFKKYIYKPLFCSSDDTVTREAVNFDALRGLDKDKDERTSMLNRSFYTTGSCRFVVFVFFYWQWWSPGIHRSEWSSILLQTFEDLLAVPSVHQTACYYLRFSSLFPGNSIHTFLRLSGRDSDRPNIKS